MKGIGAVFGFTFREQVRKKSYLISTLVLVLLTAGALCLPALIQNIRGGKAPQGNSAPQGTLTIIDASGLFDGLLQPGVRLAGYQVAFAGADEQDRLIRQTENSAKNVVAVVSPRIGQPSFDYYVKGTGTGPDPEVVGRTLRNLYAAKLLAGSGVPQPVISDALSEMAYRVHQTGRSMLSGFLPAIAVSLLLFFFIYMYGYWVAASIASEKTSRVMELLITSTKPSKIVIGKSLASGLAGLVQLLAVIVVAVAADRAANPGGLSVGGLALDFSGFTPFYAAMLILYFLLGFALYAMLNAVAGATVSNADDVRTAIMPVSMISVIAFYFAYGSMMMPDSTAAVAASIVPFSAPFSMQPRILMTNVPAWQLVLSLLLLALTTAALTVVSVRLYSAAVLHYGKRLRISELVSMARERR